MAKLQCIFWCAAPEYVFTNSFGHTIDIDNFRNRVFKKVLKKSKLPLRTRIHDLRHSYATIRLNNGDNIRDVSKQLDHSSISVTERHYDHWMPGGRIEEIDALDDPEFRAGGPKVT